MIASAEEEEDMNLCDLTKRPGVYSVVDRWTHYPWIKLYKTVRSVAEELIKTLIWYMSLRFLANLFEYCKQMSSSSSNSANNDVEKEEQQQETKEAEEQEKEKDVEAEEEEEEEQEQEEEEENDEKPDMVEEKCLYDTKEREVDAELLSYKRKYTTKSERKRKAAQQLTRSSSSSRVKHPGQDFNVSATMISDIPTKTVGFFLKLEDRNGELLMSMRRSATVYDSPAKLRTETNQFMQVFNAMASNHIFEISSEQESSSSSDSSSSDDEEEEVEQNKKPKTCAAKPKPPKTKAAPAVQHIHKGEDHVEEKEAGSDDDDDDEDDADVSETTKKEPAVLNRHGKSPRTKAVQVLSAGQEAAVEAIKVAAATPAPTIDFDS